MDGIKFELENQNRERLDFVSAFDLEKELCNFSITNIADIEKLTDKYDECLRLQFSVTTPTWETSYFYEGESIACYKKMKEAFELFKEGAIKAPWNIKKTAGTAIHVNEKSYKSAINGKFYILDEYNERISQYNIKRGLLLSELDYDGDLSVDDAESLCDGLKTYDMTDVFPPYFFGKVKMQYYGNIEVEEGNAE